MDRNLHFPIKNYYKPGSDVTVDSYLSLLDRGKDPKPMIMEFCKPFCTHWKGKLERCEERILVM